MGGVFVKAEDDVGVRQIGLPRLARELLPGQQIANEVDPGSRFVIGLHDRPSSASGTGPSSSRRFRRRSAIEEASGQIVAVRDDHPGDAPATKAIRRPIQSEDADLTGSDVNRPMNVSGVGSPRAAHP